MEQTTLSVSIGFKSHVGRVREKNEDSYAVLQRADLFGELDALIVVADGMGGGRGGDTASTIVAKNGTNFAQIGSDYSIKGGTLISGNGNELKFAQGAVDVPCNTGDVLTLKAANGQSSGSTHNVFQAEASFHTVGAI